MRVVNNWLTLLLLLLFKTVQRLARVIEEERKVLFEEMKVSDSDQ